jgi:S-adenosylmethionine:tRNA ribosyltransferase-isomerase
MSSTLDLLTSSYSYELPKSHIATHPIQPRDSARLLVYDRATETTTHTTFNHLLEYLPKELDIFLNDTRVIKARVFGVKPSGGKVEILFNKPLNAIESIVMIRGRVKVGTKILFDDGLVATVVRLLDDGLRVVVFEHRGESIRFEELVLLLDTIGHIPLPPYIDREDNSDDSRDYQTLFAKNAGAVAAPTASLHFTPKLFERLKQEYNTHTITLHVGAGTFRSVESEEILSHPMHSEYFHIPQSSADVLDRDTPILAIGTTVTRTIEYYIRTKKQKGECDLFLNPHNPPQRVEYLLTNFHLPKSTLIMLVSSFIGREKTLSLYEDAIDRGYRFFSYGDAMLIV